MSKQAELSRARDTQKVRTFLPTLITTALLASPVDYCTAHAPRARESLYFLRSELPSLFPLCSSLDLRRLACLNLCLALQLYIEASTSTCTLFLLNYSYLVFITH